MPRLIDLSVALDPDLVSDPDIMQPQVTISTTSRPPDR